MDANSASCPVMRGSVCGAERRPSPLQLRAGNPSATSKLRTLLRVQTESSVQVPIAIYSDHAFLETHQRSQLGLGVYYGVLIGLLLYNLLIFLSVRDRSYPYYIGYVALFGLALACLNGISYQILWPTWPLWDDAVLLLAIGEILTCMVLFTYSFLELPTRQTETGATVPRCAAVTGGDHACLALHHLSPCHSA